MTYPKFFIQLTQVPPYLFQERLAQLLPDGKALDDFGEPLWSAKDGFERISTYDSGEVTLNKHRQLTLTAIPYRRRSAGRGFTWYERVPDLPRP